MITKNHLKRLLPVSVLALVILGAVFAVPKGSVSNPVLVVQSPGTPLPLHVTLNGRGASFPQPLIQAWQNAYPITHPNITVNYASVGSGAGQLAAADKASDFSATDQPLPAAQRPLYPNILHIPETIGSVTVSYNLTAAHITQSLNFTGLVVAEIYLGQIHLWNDPAIQALNPGVTLPNQNITTVHRSDGSGTTFVFTSYLASQDPTWTSTCGAPTTTFPTACQGSATCSPFPCAITGNGNAGVANQIATHNYALGYVELNYAIQHSFTFGTLRNADNTAWVSANLTTTTNAVNQYMATHTLPSGSGDWSGVSMLNQLGIDSYPIASFTYLLVYRELNVLPSMNLNETTQAQALIAFLNWVVTTGQAYSSGLSYVPLPASVVAVDQSSINSISYTINSTPLTHTYHIGVSSTAGFNLTKTSVVSGDTVNLDLASTDGTAHQWFIDFNNNGVLDSNENNTTVSNIFTSQTLYTFVPKIFNSHSIPALGNWTFRDSQNPSNTGTITIIPQQIAIPFVPPANSLTSSLIPTIDTSRITTQGSLIVDMRTQLFGGNVSEITVDKTSGSLTSQKVYTLSGLKFKTSTSGPQSLFVLKAATSPNATSSDVTVTLTGLTGATTYSVSRNLDMGLQGTIDIVDLATVAFHFGTLLGQPNYSAITDVNADGAVNIQDLALVAFYFNDPAFS